MILLTDEEIRVIFLNHFTKQYGEEAVKELLDKLPNCTYAKAIRKAQLKRVVEWLMLHQHDQYENFYQFDVEKRDMQALLEEVKE